MRLLITAMLLLTSLSIFATDSEITCEMAYERFEVCKAREDRCNVNNDFAYFCSDIYMECIEPFQEKYNECRKLEESKEN